AEMERAFKHSRKMGLEGIRCFVCAPLSNNPQSLNLEFVETEEGAQTEFSIGGGLQSYPGFVHGGILSAILDETMAYAGVFHYEYLPLTRRMSLSFRRAVEADKLYICRSKLLVVGKDGFTASAIISSPGRGNLLLAEGEFIL